MTNVLEFSVSTPVAAGTEGKIDSFIIHTDIFNLLQRHMISIYMYYLQTTYIMKQMFNTLHPFTCITMLFSILKFIAQCYFLLKPNFLYMLKGDLYQLNLWYREIYHTKRMQRVRVVQWSLDNKYIISGSDEMNIRVWKARASEKLGMVRINNRMNGGFN